MFSLEPATITGGRYPLLFQTGETAYGNPIVDGQHPHNLIMGLGFHYAHALGEDTMLELYFAPSATLRSDLSPIRIEPPPPNCRRRRVSHHWQDSTHISDEVVTVGVRYKKVKLEASGFYGSEPGENRWIIEAGPINSWSARLWFVPQRTGLLRSQREGSPIRRLLSLGIRSGDGLRAIR